MITAQPSVIIAIIGCGLLALSAGFLFGYQTATQVTDRKLRQWMLSYGKTPTPKPRAGWRYYV